MNIDNMRWHTEDQETFEDPEYQKVLVTVQSLWTSGMIQRGCGQCYAMSDIVKKMLSFIGIESYLQECSLMVMTKNPPQLHMVGHPFCNVQDKVSDVRTHVVCITKTKIPLLIDLSISNFISDIPYICEPLKNQDSNNISDYDFENSYFKYSRKVDSELPILHQQSIIDRLQTDKRIFSSIDKITKVLIGIVIITSINFIRGGYDFYAKYINDSNGFGPHKLK